MGTLDQSTGTSVTRKIAFLNVTGKTPNEIETLYNTNYGKKGWRIIQVVVIGTQNFLVGEKEE